MSITAIKLYPNNSMKHIDDLWKDKDYLNQYYDGYAFMDFNDCKLTMFVPVRESGMKHNQIATKLFNSLYDSRCQLNYSLHGICFIVDDNKPLSAVANILKQIE